MRIAQIAPLAEPVPPTGAGAIEYVVSLLTEELVKRGHEVVLFASGDSQTTAELRSVSPLSFRGLGRPEVLLEYAHTLKAFRSAIEDCDLIHNHSDFFGIGLRELSPLPVLSTLHSHYDTPGALSLLQQFAAAPCVALSHSHRRFLPPELNVRHIIPHGLPIDQFPFQADKEEFLLFLGRMHPAKGADLAIEAARQAGLPLVIAAKLDWHERAYWEEVIRPQIDGRQVIFVGEVDATQKVELLRRAKALLFPAVRPEPFGLVMIEALACGTPVIALRRGAVSEMVLDGETGFIAETPAGLPYAVRHLDQLDPHRCRQDAEARFSVGRMVDDYLAAYRAVDAGLGFGAGLPAWPMAAAQVMAGELAEYFQMADDEARHRLANAPLLLARAWWGRLSVADDDRMAFWQSEPLAVFERANQALATSYRLWLASATQAAAEAAGGRWLSYCSDVGQFALAIDGPVDVVERPGPVHDFIHWRLARRGLPAAVRPLVDPAALPAETYDGIVALGGMEREDDPQATLEALARTLKPGGWLFLSPELMAGVDQPWVPANGRTWLHRFRPETLDLEPAAGGGAWVFRRQPVGSPA